jgi:hypothetical protein
MNYIIEIKTNLGGFCPCTLEVGYEEGEIAVLSICPDVKFNDRYLIFDKDNPIFDALASLLDQQHIEDVVNDKRDNGSF